MGNFANRIIWDTDGEEVDLPTEVELPDSVNQDDVADYLSDTYGWCVISCYFVFAEERN